MHKNYYYNNCYRNYCKCLVINIYFKLYRYFTCKTKQKQSIEYKHYYKALLVNIICFNSIK